MSYTTMIELMKSKNKLIVGDVSKCDCCGREDVMYFDGPMIGGRFAYMCGECYLTEGKASSDLLLGPTTILVSDMSKVKDNPFTAEIKEIVELRSPLLYKELTDKQNKKTSSSLTLTGDSSGPYMTANHTPDGYRNIFLNSPNIDFMSKYKLNKSNRDIIRNYLKSVIDLSGDLLEDLISVIGYKYGVKSTYMLVPGTEPRLNAIENGKVSTASKLELRVLLELAKNLRVSNYSIVKKFFEENSLPLESKHFASSISSSDNPRVVVIINDMLFVCGYKEGIIKKLTLEDLNNKYKDIVSKFTWYDDWLRYYFQINDMDSSDTYKIKGKFVDYDDWDFSIKDNSLILNKSGESSIIFTLDDIKSMVSNWGTWNYAPDEDNDEQVDCCGEDDYENPSLEEMPNKSTHLSGESIQSLLDSTMKGMCSGIITNVENLEYLSKESNIDNNIDLEQLIELEESFKTMYEKLRNTRRNLEDKSSKLNSFSKSCKN